MEVSEASKRWTDAVHNWKVALNHFSTVFEERMAKDKPSWAIADVGEVEVIP